MTVDLKLLSSVPPDESLVMLLEEMTEKARRGELRSIAAVLVYRDQAHGYAHGGEAMRNDIVRMIGESVMLQHRLVDLARERE